MFNERITKPGKNVIAWCYGDLSILYSIVYSAKIIGNKGLFDKGVKLLKELNSRNESYIGFVRDSCLCFGAVGVSLLYQRIYSLTQDRAFFKSKVFWTNRAIDLLNGDKDVLPYTFFDNNVGNYVPKNGILFGYCGVGLAFVTLLRPSLNKWSNCVLLQ
jgi:hypothetical protein